MLDVAGYRSRIGPTKDWGLWGSSTLHTDLLILRAKSSLQHYFHILISQEILLTTKHCEVHKAMRKCTSLGTNKCCMHIRNAVWHTRTLEQITDVVCGISADES